MDFNTPSQLKFRCIEGKYEKDINESVNSFLQGEGHNKINVVKIDTKIITNRYSVMIWYYESKPLDTKEFNHVFGQRGDFD